MKKNIILITLFFLCIFFTNARSITMDSLHLALQKATTDTAKVNIYFALCNQCDINDNLKYAQPLIKILDKLIAQTNDIEKKKQLLQQKAEAYGFVRYYYTEMKDTFNVVKTQKIRISIYEEASDNEAIIGSIRGLSNFYIAVGNYPKGIQYCQQALQRAKKMNYKKGIAGCLYQIAEIYRSQDENSQALEKYEQSISMYTEIKDTASLAQVFMSKGDLHGKLHDISKALQCYLKSLSLYELIKNNQQVRRVYSCIGGMYMDNHEFQKALLNYQKCMSMSEDMKDIYWIGITSGNIGSIYLTEGNFQKALEFNTKSLKIFEEIKEEAQIANANHRLANTYLKLKEYNKAKLCIERSIEIEKRNLFSNNLKKSELLATTIDSAKGDFKGAFEHYKQYILLNNKLKSEEIHQLVQKEKYQNEYEKQKAIDKAISDHEIETHKIVRNSFMAGFAFMILLAAISYRNYRRKKKDNLIISNQKLLVEEKQKEILDSIEYALRIQTAILPTQKILKQHLENFFILYKPKDIVAGDFYWMEKVDDLILLAACDCTGHGVPGAMVSVICYNALNRAVREFGLTQPAKILDKTAEIVIENFSKSEEDIKDGMDISLCAYNPINNTMQWAGANNPLWIIQNGIIMETKANKQPIGMNDDRIPFMNHTFNLNKTDSFFLFTDGFADQFGGDSGQKKLTRKRFKELILSLQNKSMQEQGVELDKYIIDYRKDIEQIDDILVIGVKI
ncbi:MAG TPA: tetratricopeptide repeat protein [Bacteroidia bacterium]|nr:tetratricopeptide repeat protein [Bacteroidia bacterium]